MWKIFFKYSDGSKCTITGNADITMKLAMKCFVRYGISSSEAIFQQYPKKDNPPITLLEKIENIGGKEAREKAEAFKNELLSATDKIMKEIKDESRKG